MEFERALFRIHQRTLDSEDIRVARLRLEKALPWAFAALAGCWALSHAHYVGRSRCLPEALRRAGLWNATQDSPDLPEDALLGLAVLASDGEGPPKAALVNAELEAVLEGRPPPGAPVAVAAISSYTFAFDREVLALRPETVKSHGFKVHNVSVPENCLAGPGLLGASLRLFEGYDGMVINELAYTFRSRGYLHRLGSGASGAESESWAWVARQVEAASPPTGDGVLVSLSRKLKILLKSILISALMSAITGFFIRIAVNGSAVLMFMVAIASKHFAWQCGSGVPSLRLLGRSFPWIGVHVGLLSGAGRPLWPLLRAHFAFLLVQSFAYLSCSLAWRVVLYRKSCPEGFADQLFGLCSILELFNLVFVRSASSAAVFPKLTCACLVYLHFYTLCAFYPCHSLALATCAVACFWVMVYCLNHYEEPALLADPFAHTTPTAAHPRALYLPQLSPAWSLEAAPLWTMFWPPEPPSAFPEGAMRHISDEEYIVS